MFSKTVGDFSNLIECTFLAGVNISSINEGNYTINSDVKVECLLCIPEGMTTHISEGVLEVKISHFDN